MNEVERLLGGESEWLRLARLAVRAGWWTLLVGVVFLTFGWLSGLLLLGWGGPGWMLRLWGGVSVEEFRLLWMSFLGLMKLGLFFLLLVLIWATLWLRAAQKEGLEG